MAEELGFDKVLLFVGNDVTSNIVLNRLVPLMKRLRYRPVICMTGHVVSPKANHPTLLRAAFHERGLLNQVVLPFIDKRPFESNNKGNAACLSPKSLGEKFGYEVLSVPDVNDPKFIEKIRSDDRIVGGFSIRCFQIFKKEIIEVLNGTVEGDKKFFINIHPGMLPDYRGVMSIARAMADGQDFYGWTTHHIDTGIDTGALLRKKAKPFTDPSKTALENTVNIAGSGADALHEILLDHDKGNVLAGFPQDFNKGRYYTFPTAAELASWDLAGIRLCDPESTYEIYIENYSVPRSSHAICLRAAMEKATGKFERNLPANDSVQLPSGAEQKFGAFGS